MDLEPTAGRRISK